MVTGSQPVAIGQMQSYKREPSGPKITFLNTVVAKVKENNKNKRRGKVIKMLSIYELVITN